MAHPAAQYRTVNPQDQPPPGSVENDAYYSTIGLMAALDGVFSGMGIAIVKVCNLIPNTLKNLWQVRRDGWSETVGDDKWSSNHSPKLIYNSYYKSAAEEVGRSCDAPKIERNKLAINLIHFVGIIASAIICNYFFPIIATSFLISLIIMAASAVFVKLITKPNVPAITNLNDKKLGVCAVARQFFGGIGNYLGVFIIPKTIIVLLNSNFFSVLLNLIMQLAVLIGAQLAGVMVFILLVWLAARCMGV